MGDIFWVAKVSNIFFGLLEIPDFFWGGWMLGPSLPMKKNESTPPPLGSV